MNESLAQPAVNRSEPARNPVVPFIPDTAPFTVEQRAWLNGFLAGMFSRVPAGTPGSAPAPTPPAKPVLVLYGSQTGNSERLAKRAAKEAAKRGFAPVVREMSIVPAAQLAGETAALLITSTYGDGEPPDNARALHAALASPAAPRLEKLAYSVCALGDRNYARFCQCGRDFDSRLAALGARRAAALVECDTDFETHFGRWLETALAALSGDTDERSVERAEVAAGAQGTADIPQSGDASRFHCDRPFQAPVLAVRRLSGTGSAKEVNHIEFALDGSDLTYEVGDALGVIPQNDDALVAAVLELLGCDGEEPVSTSAGELPLRTALLQYLDLGRPIPELLTACGLSPASHLFHVIDVISAPGARRLAPTDFVRNLKRLKPRLYSICSSPKAHPGHVHLTVGAVRYELHGRVRHGVASTFLADRVTATGHAGVYVHSNKSFRPPVSGDTPMIMVGPGTGIAPFRAFLEERRAVGAKGRNWLFFGDQRAATDFLYREELATMTTEGVLTRFDLAWSRDQAAKIYVQDRMREQADTLWAWLEEGAHFYVCGDATRMAKDVHAALERAVESAGGKTPDQAAEYLDALIAARRYQRDVY